MACHLPARGRPRVHEQPEPHTTARASCPAAGGFCPEADRRADCHARETVLPLANTPGVCGARTPIYGAAQGS